MFLLLEVIPRYHDLYSNSYNMHALIALFISAQAITNMYCMIIIDTTIRNPQLNLPSVLKQGWKYCYDCRLNAPPRSHHCPVCNVCVLKRDHHCIFTGNCVGALNHRHFIVFCAWVWVGNVWVLGCGWEVYMEVLGSGFGLIPKCFFPILVFFAGYITAHQLLVLVVMLINVSALILVSLLLGFQVLCISRGQTQFEYQQKRRDYCLGLAKNWKMVLGDAWYLVWLSCFVNSTLPFDPIRSDERHLKL